uniref:Rv1733c family protein n=1 Tax=Streptomyces griseicoloratus TaxID=2752516 RepID=UPI002810C50E|nr:hypothetical protein [Streptomyces griseicoloratus]
MTDALEQRRAERQAVTATVVGPATRSDGDSGATAGDQVFAAVHWTAPDGTRHSGRTWVDERAETGDHVVAWTDQQDRLVPRPPTRAQVEMDAVVTGAAASLAVAGATAAGYYGIHIGLDRRRRLAWEAEWRQVASHWGQAAN